MSEAKKKKVVSGDDAWILTGQRMSDAEVAEYNRLAMASKVRSLTSAEENRLWVLSQRNKLRTQVL